MSYDIHRKCSKCGATPYLNEAVRLHRFPKLGISNVLKLKIWAMYCWPEKDWTLESLQNLYRQHHCGKHFQECFFIDSSKKRLFQNAVPGTKEFVTKTLKLLENSGLASDIQVPPTIPEAVPGPSGIMSHREKIGEAVMEKIGTHNGVFHCDEVLACYMLKRLEEYKDAEIIRTRDPEELKTCDIVVDVGAEFDHARRRYDHHQREFNETLSTLKTELGDKYKIKLSSAGLIYAYYGERVIQTLAPKDNPLTPENLTAVYKKVYEHFIEEMDAIDNGVPMTDEEPRYKIRTHLSARVGRLNPEWNSTNVIDIDEIFKKAMTLVSGEFEHTVNYFISVWLPARDYVKSALENREQVHESGLILEFTERFPWKEHLFDLEEEMGIGHEIKYVIFKDKPNSWRVQAIPVSPSSFITRKPLNKSWWGVRDEMLSDVAGIKGCVFCHSTGFIGGNVSREGALQMAVQSLNAET